GGSSNSVMTLPLTTSSPISSSTISVNIITSTTTGTTATTTTTTTTPPTTKSSSNNKKPAPFQNLGLHSGAASGNLGKPINNNNNNNSYYYWNTLHIYHNIFFLFPFYIYVRGNERMRVYMYESVSFFLFF